MIGEVEDDFKVDVVDGADDESVEGVELHEHAEYRSVRVRSPGELVGWIDAWAKPVVLLLGFERLRNSRM